MAVINQINLVNNVGESETYDIETKITEAVSKYIDNQNKLSDFETITVATSSANPTEMPYDGFLVINRTPTAVAGTVYSTVNINGVSFSANYSTTGNFILSLRDTFPVKKGDLVYVTGFTNSQPQARFFKDRDYSNR